MSQEMLREPVACSDGCSYEKVAVEDWLKNHDTSFVTGKLLPDLFVVPTILNILYIIIIIINRGLKSRLQELNG